jgi:acyl-coenzyme A thioesterase PaaI-like protein
MHLPSLLAKARTSVFTRWLLNRALPWSIPFNRPHGFKVVPLPEGGISVKVPYWRINQNHIRGIHACCLATASEMCSGLSLLEQLDPKHYRLIMRSLHMQYHYQAKQGAVATCIDSRDTIQEHVVRALASQDAVDHTSTVEVHDTSGNHLATGTITWQVKEWSKVRTKR